MDAPLKSAQDNGHNMVNITSPLSIALARWECATCGARVHCGVGEWYGRASTKECGK